MRIAEADADPDLAQILENFTKPQDSSLISKFFLSKLIDSIISEASSTEKHCTN